MRIGLHQPGSGCPRSLHRRHPGWAGVRAAALGRGPNVVGAGVAKTQTDLAADTVRLLGGLDGLAGLNVGSEAVPVVLDGCLGPGYAQPSEGAERAADLLATTEAILTDPVYSAKGLHALVDLARTSPDAEPLVFWHTGGLPALFSDSVGITTWPDMT